MQLVIYKKTDPTLMVETVGSSYNPQLTNDADNAMSFTTQTAADAMIGNLPGGAEFWGSRPKRPK